MEKGKHSVAIDNKEKLFMTDVAEVVSFSEKGLELLLSDGAVQITGQGLKMEHISVETGEIRLSGKIISVYYPEEERKKGFMKGLFE